jgi:hypothetical protein
VSTPALKEWAVIVRALLAGEQLLDLRKGGIREDGRHFAVRSDRLWLYPTVEHQRAELVKPAYRRWLEDANGLEQGQPIEIAGWADVVGVLDLTGAQDLAKLEGKVIWTSDYAASRLQWKRRDPLTVLALRTFRLTAPRVVPWKDEYRGCTSWVDLDGLPDDPSTLESQPALSDESFTARLGLIENDLGRAFERPSV